MPPKPKKHNPDREVIEYIRPNITDYQEKALFGNERYAMIEASTKTGKTVGCIVWLIEQTMKLRRGQNTWWVAPVSSQANIAFKRAMIFLPRSMYSFNLTDKTITLPNGATIWFKGADKPNSLYGEDVFAAVVDEASRVKEDAWFAVRSTLTATKGKVRLIGNVKGRKNWFFHLCRMAENGEPNMVYHKLTAYDAVRAGILSLDEVEDAKRKLPSHIFNELYLAEPSDDGGNPFGLRAIQNCVDQNYEPIEPGQLDISWRSKWSEPVGWGWDLAKSHDWCVGVGLNEDGGVAALERFQLPWEQTVARIVSATAGNKALVDSTGVGDPVLERLQTLAPGQFEGFKFTSASKQQLMEGLALAIHGQEITYPNGIIVLELEQFEFMVTRTGVRYTAPQGLHDDVVCALALAVQKMKTPRAYFFEVN